MNPLPYHLSVSHQPWLLSKEKSSLLTLNVIGNLEERRDAKEGLAEPVGF